MSELPRIAARPVLVLAACETHLAVSRSLDVPVARLRSELDRPGLLATVRGCGFRLGGG